jgi:3-methyladenine DNA glycosylase AlkC
MSDTENFQEHFSLMGECLDPELPEEEQIDALLEHAEKELSLTVKLQAREAFQYARASVERAHLLNDLCAGIQSAFSRLSIAWLFESGGGECPISEHAEYLAAVTTALLPPLYKVEGRH